MEKQSEEGQDEQKFEEKKTARRVSNKKGAKKKVIDPNSALKDCQMEIITERSESQQSDSESDGIKLTSHKFKGATGNLSVLNAEELLKKKQDKYQPIKKDSTNTLINSRV